MLNSISNITDHQTQQTINGIVKYMENDLIGLVKKMQKRIKTSTDPIIALNSNVTSCQTENIDRLQEIHNSIKTQMAECSNIPAITYKSLVEECKKVLAVLEKNLNNCKDYPNNVMIQGCLMQYSSTEVVDTTNITELREKYENIRKAHKKGSELDVAINCLTDVYGKQHADVDVVKVLVENCVHEMSTHITYRL
ncbi:hypothetical protein KM043_017326 [Ampulex compressa]|nr:hypothetical protein KM043_017326 [Ampulex compressa]